MGKLKERMQNELRIRGYSDRTVILYLDHMKRFVKHFKKSPDLLGPEEIYQYQSHLAANSQYPDRRVYECPHHGAAELLSSVYCKKSKIPSQRYRCGMNSIAATERGFVQQVLP